MKETRPCDVSNGRSYLLTSMNYINAECIDGISSNIIAIYSRDQDLTLMIVDEQAANHDDSVKKKLFDYAMHWIKLKKKFKFSSWNIT